MGVVGVDHIAAQRAQVAALVRDFEPGLLSAADCVRVREHATALKNMAATLEVLAAARVAATQLATDTGAATAAEDLARVTGTSTARAKDALHTAQRLREQPDLDAAMRAGELSPEQASLVSDAAVANPRKERDLIDTAKRDSLRGLRTECDRTRAAADPDPEATRARVHRDRRLRLWTDGDIARLFGQTTKAQLVAIRGAIDAKTDALFAQARREGRREPREAYAMDALHAICAEWLEGRGAEPEATEPEATEPKATKPKARVIGILRVDLSALRRDNVDEGETCEIDGLGPIDLATARDLLGDALLHLVITDGIAVRNVTHLGRRPTVAQQVALAWERRGRCRITGCDRSRLQHDHARPWADCHVTELDNLDDLCGHHHELKTRGWHVVEHPDGTVTIHPPVG